jgi:hypothetical protein
LPSQDAAQPEGTEDAAMKDASADGEAASASVQEAAGASDTGAAPMETEEVMQKKIRSIKKSVPVEGKTLSFSDTQIMVRSMHASQQQQKLRLHECVRMPWCQLTCF